MLPSAINAQPDVLCSDTQRLIFLSHVKLAYPIYKRKFALQRLFKFQFNAPYKLVKDMRFLICKKIIFSESSMELELPLEDIAQTDFIVDLALRLKDSSARRRFIFKCYTTSDFDNYEILQIFTDFRMSYYNTELEDLIFRQEQYFLAREQMVPTCPISSRELINTLCWYGKVPVYDMYTHLTHYANELMRIDLLPHGKTMDDEPSKDTRRKAWFRKKLDKKRFNEKEEKVLKYKQYLKKQEAKKVKPHAEEPPGMNKSSTRNDLLRAAIDAPPQDPPADKELMDLLETVSVSPDILGETAEDTAEWISYLENIVILGWQLHKSTCFSDVFVSIIGYIKMHTNRSIIRDLLLLIDNFTKHFAESEVEPHAMDEPLMELPLDNGPTGFANKWDLLKTNQIFTKISYLITAAMSLTVCTVKKIEWSPFGLQLVALEAAKEQLKAVDVIDSLVHTFAWLCESGYRVFQQRSLLPLLYSDSKTQQFNEDCDYIIAHADGVLSGNSDLSVQDYEYKVDKALRDVTAMKAAKANGPTGIWLQQKYSILVDIKYKIVAKYKNTAIRSQPLGIGITGPSGVGKSTLAKILMKVCLFAMGFDPDPKRIMTKDMFDEYDSTYTSDILGLYMDDVGNGKPEFVKNSPTDVIIKFFNNMAAQAVKAELNQKGIVFIGFKVGILTSNFKDFQVKLYTDKPEAALRRFTFVRTRVKQKYRIKGGLSLNKSHPDISPTDLCQDIWEVDIEEVFVFETKAGKETYIFRPYKALINGVMRDCKNLGLKDCLNVMIVLAKQHQKEQENVVSRSELFDKMVMCSRCCLPEPMCTCEPVPDLALDLRPEVEEVEVHGVEEAAEKLITGIRFMVDKYVQYKPTFEHVNLGMYVPKNIPNKVIPYVEPVSEYLLDTFTPTFKIMSLLYFKTYGYVSRISQYKAGFTLVTSLLFPSRQYIFASSLIYFGPKFERLCDSICAAVFNMINNVYDNVQPHAFEDLGEVIVNSAYKGVVKYVKDFLNPVAHVNSILGYSPIKYLSTFALSREFSEILKDQCTPVLVSLTPDFVFDSFIFQKMIMSWQHSAALYNIRIPMRIGSLACTLGMAYNIKKKNTKNVKYVIIGSWFFYMTMWAHYRARIRMIKHEYTHRRDALPALMGATNQGYVAKGTFMAATLLVGLKLFKLWNINRLAANKLTPTGSLSCEAMDSNPSWFGFMMSRMGVTVGNQYSVKCTTPSQIIESLQKNSCFWAEFLRSDGTKAACNIFFPRKGVAWFPQHMFHPKCDLTVPPVEYLTVTVHRHKKAGGKFVFKTQLDFCSTLPDLDLVCAYVPNSPDLPNRLKWLPTSLPTGTSACKFLTRKMHEFSMENLTVDHGRVGHKYKQFYGGSYGTNLGIFGACMGPLVLDQTNPVIIGFHIGGNEDYKMWTGGYGVMQTVLLSQAEELIAKLDAIPGTILSTNTGTIPATQYDKTIIASPDVHPHCMAARLTNDNYLDVLGATHLRAKARSNVEQSILSTAVEAVTGIPNTWAGPKMNPNWEAFNKTLENIANPTDMFVPRKLEKARQDWLRPLIRAMEIYKEIYEFRVLTDKESIMGIDGTKYIDALPMKTGMGFPVFGPKSRHFTNIHEGQKLVDRIPDAGVRTEIARLLACWERGERGYPVSTSTLKDTPTTIGSEKCRVFQAVPVAFGILIRKRFLPIARFLTMHPELSECAVGVNAFSYQWVGLMDHAEKFAADGQVIAWDYKKYDVSMSSQITRAVLLSYIELAKVGGYGIYDLTVMRAMVNDMTHPLIDYNGALIMSYNMNTSGNNITVQVNSTAGSLYVRMGFFDVYPDEEDFRKCVAALTYGDDYKGSVHPDFRDFNYLSYKEYLAQFRMKITPPDKDESHDDTAFMDVGDTDFLKRVSQFIPEINTSIGKLDEMSIFKSLHSNVRSKGALKEEVARSCIETAMHEWFAHGREVYELRAAQMTQVCEMVSMPVKATRIPFDDRVDHWKCKYNV